MCSACVVHAECMRSAFVVYLRCICSTCAQCMCMCRASRPAIGEARERRGPERSKHTQGHDVQRRGSLRVTRQL